MKLVQRHRIVRFSVFEVDLDAAELRRNGERLKIQEQPFQILCQLLERPGEIVTREEVKQRLWPEDTFVDFEQGLNSAVKKLRDVLGDAAENSRFVETIPRRGYRFVHSVEPQLETARTESASSRLVSHANERSQRVAGPILFAVAVLAIGLASFLFVGWNRSNRQMVVVPPVYRQLTFARQLVKSARFAPDQQTIVYTSSSGGTQGELLLLVPGALAPSSLGLKDSEVEAISPDGEMLVVGSRRILRDFAQVGLLSRTPMTGGTPRPVLDDVQDADWGPDHQIAVARAVNERYRVEYPIGHVLYESSGYVSNVRVSPSGNMVAFAEHPTMGDDSGMVSVVDTKGRKTTLTRLHDSLVGIAWTPDGSEVWFSCAQMSDPDQLAAVDLRGHVRRVANTPGGTPVIEDVSKDGRGLIIHQTRVESAVALGAGAEHERDLSIRDWSGAEGISSDGRQVLISESGVGSHPAGDIYLRRSDGAPPAHLGEGNPDGFSPDMKWVLASRQQLFLIPVGPGETKQITHDSLVHNAAGFLPDGKRVFFNGIEPGHGNRIYIQTVGEDDPRPISPEGVLGSAATADGKYVFGNSDKVRLYAVDGHEAPRDVPGLGLEEGIGAFSADGRYAYIAASPTHVVLDLIRLDLVTGKRSLVKTIAPADTSGVFMYSSIFITPDLRYYVYSYNRSLSELYTVDGLR